MQTQMDASDLIKIGSFVESYNAFVDTHTLILDADILASFPPVPMYDSNGDLLGRVQICDWGDFGFVPFQVKDDNAS
jgi:hypothetical protein